MSSIEINNIERNPKCPHGPTILFSKLVNGIRRNFYACSACRDRKDCNFFLYEEDLLRFTESKQKIWNEESEKLTKINPKELISLRNEIKQLPIDSRTYCNTCSKFVIEKDLHQNHSLIKNITDRQLNYPTEFLPPLENNKKEAQYLFSKKAVTFLVNLCKDLDFRKILCIGTPRIHEYIRSECKQDMTSLLLDIDCRFYNFFTISEFCWYNSFNHHFFLLKAKRVFEKYFRNNGQEDRKLAIFIDPPFGGRIELLAHTLNKINELYNSLNNRESEEIPIFFISPYFMEPQILNYLPDFSMLDYKVDYDNHPLFHNGPNGRKLGSPVRIFTNINPSEIFLPVEEGYKYCNDCERWISKENRHCNLCKLCTSKDGRTYVHCNKCKRCVKPTWIHCENCNLCVLAKHKCGNIIEFTQKCFECKEFGHKKCDCPKITNNQTRGIKHKLKTHNNCKKKILKK